MPAGTIGLAIPVEEGRASLDALSAIAPGAEVTLSEPLRFGSSAGDDIMHLVFLREATSQAVRLTWRLAGIPAVAFRSLVHLQPPADGDATKSAAYAKSWREQYQYGLYYYRCGPDFIQVKDIRPGGPAARMTIEDGGRFQELVASTSVNQLSEPGVDALNTAIDADLAIACGDRFAVLPYRMRHWPVSCIAV